MFFLCYLQGTALVPLELQEIRQETENEVEFHIAEEWAMDNEDATLLSKRNYFNCSLDNTLPPNSKAHQSSLYMGIIDL